MLVIPAIDLLGGRPVRLVQGDYLRVLGFEVEAVELGRRFQEDGASWLHVVDLEGARLGRWCQLDLIAEIAAATGLPVQAGGGARTPSEVARALERGVRRVIVATAALGSREALAELAAEFGDALVVSLDTRQGLALAQGWAVEARLDLVTAAGRAVDCGVRRLIHTDAQRDGTMAGPGLGGLRQLVPFGVPVMVAGGVSGYGDLEQAREAGAEAAIVGRALIGGALDLRLAQERVA